MAGANRASTQVSSPATTRPSSSQQAPGEDGGQHQLTLAVDDLLDQLQNKFEKVSTEIFGKLDDMARRLDQLEASLAASGDANKSN
ncbi:hypothetical protein AJ80_03934 [Polytolypa hystricis UAMH7299]|uniref:Heat shock factor-binding protein 1 n=1 Tax=Polytolypa hystricis (strain UAMH7299) TaxID=1447883 RepID=A0A2B7YEH1_POLH7|nr:hypothetical protein AJ80_03934 [Polytolypa hystricis UAMH7299]